MYNQKIVFIPLSTNKLMFSCFGHIARREGDSLEEVFMQGCVEEKRKTGRSWTSWIDQIKTMVKCSIAELYNNLAQDRHRWRGIVAVTSCQTRQEPYQPSTTTRFCFACLFFVCLFCFGFFCYLECPIIWYWYYCSFLMWIKLSTGHSGGVSF